MTKTQPSAINGLEKNRVYVKGKFLYVSERKFCMKGVTYGTFSPDDNGQQFPQRAVVEKDFP